jgi:hypothetical protein
VSRVTVLALSALLVACGPDREAQAKQGAARVARAVELLRNAPNDAKHAPLEALSQLSCSTPDICQTRDVCQAAYTLHLDAIKLTRAAKLDAQEGKTEQATRLLMSAQSQLNDASKAVADCIERESVLRRAYKL